MSSGVDTVREELSRPSRVFIALRQKVRWARQGHVLLAFALTAKLIWFDEQVRVRFVSPEKWMATVGTVLLLTSLLPLLRPRLRLMVGLTLDALLSILILADLLYFRFFGGLLTVGVLEQSSQTLAVLGSIRELVEPTDLLLFADLAAAGVVLVARGHESLLRSSEPYLSRRTRELVVFTLIIGATFVAVPVEAQRRTGDAFDSWWDMATYQATGLVGFHVYDSGRFALRHVAAREATPRELREVRRHFAAPVENGPPARSPGSGEFADANVLVLQLEALQEFPIGLRIGGVEVTPHLNDLIRESIYFSDFWHQTASGHTSDAELLAGCSLYPARHGTAFFEFAANELDCLPEILGSHGYSSAAHHPYLGSFWNRTSMYQALGYDVFYDLSRYSQEEPLGWSIGDASFLRQTVRQLQERPQPFYDVAITLTSHHPYEIEGLPRAIDTGRLSGSILDRYVQAVHYVDGAIGSMIEEMRRTGLWDNTIVVIYGDHDSGIYDEPLLEDLLDRPLGTLELTEMSRSVPLIVHLPSDAHAGLRIDTPTGQVDVAPMLLDLLGLSTRGQYMLGANRFTRDSSPVVFRDGGFADASHLFVPDASSADMGRCFDRSTGQSVDMGRCTAGRSKAEQALHISDLILEHDLLRQLHRPSQAGAHPPAG